jgi:hypothetical protein
VSPGGLLRIGCNLSCGAGPFVQPFHGSCVVVWVPFSSCGGKSENGRG